jgi:hypothetical protein
MINNRIVLANFYKRAQKDQRLLPSHLAVFTAICMLFDEDITSEAIRISRKKVMAIAKIQSKSTYHRCINELVEFDYIIYKPSYNHYLGTYVTFPKSFFAYNDGD